MSASGREATMENSFKLEENQTLTVKSSYDYYI